MAHKLTTVAALGILVAAAGMPLAVAQPVNQSAQQEETDEIRVYELGDMFEGDDASSWTINSIQSLLRVRIAWVGGDRYAVSATPTEHARLDSMLAQIFGDNANTNAKANTNASGQTYTVRILAGVALDAAAPAVGDRFPASGIQVLFAPQMIVGEGDNAFVRAMESETYISGYQPVVSDSAVAYDPGTDEMETGVEMEITVEGAGDDAVEISLEGRIAKGEVRSQTLKLGDSSLPIGLPFVRDRNIEADITLPTSDTPTVVASLPGFELGTRLVIAVQVADFGRRRGN